MSWHTAGPWEISSLDGRSIGPVSYTHTDPFIRQYEIPQQQVVAVARERLDREETAANARLIAACPTMLAELLATRDWLESFSMPPTAAIAEKEERLAAINAAIALATRQPTT